MQDKYVPPQFQITAFHCPLCHVYAAQRWAALRLLVGNGYEMSPIHAGHCGHCHERHYWLQIGNQQGRLFYPDASNAPPFHPDMPEAVRADYLEAAAVLGRSPRSAAALLRLALQKLLKELGMPGKNIDADIKELVRQGLPVMVQQALDVCRVVGNEAVHPGELDLNDSPEMAASLFGMLNFIVADRIEHPKKIADLYMKIPAQKREWIEQRDKAAKPLAPTPPDAPGPAENPAPQD